jgi:riboflavin kinase/FMN adenylyltransferase
LAAVFADVVMKIYRGFQDRRLKCRARAIAIGIFDGVHRGHQLILKKAMISAKKMRTTPLVITFDPHPQKVLFPKHRNPKILMSLEHRLRFFSSLGIREALMIPFNKKFSNISHETFLEDFLIKQLRMKSLSVGHDFRFGYKALGECRYLEQQSKKMGFRLFLSRPLSFRGRIISSTRIRQLIEAGDLKQASSMLGRPVSVYGTVVHGRGRGRSVGFPTANLNPHHETLPPPGVYAVSGHLAGRSLKGLVHIGPRPTFRDKEKSLEVHFLDFKRKIYGRELELFFLAKLRGVRTFSSRETLANQIQKDIQKSKSLMGG